MSRKTLSTTHDEDLDLHTRFAQMPPDLRQKADYLIFALCGKSIEEITDVGGSSWSWQEHRKMMNELRERKREFEKEKHKFQERIKAARLKRDDRD